MWRDGRYRPLTRVTIPGGAVSSLYGFVSFDLVEDRGDEEFALVASNGRLRVFGSDGRLLWEGEEDLGLVSGRGFAQTPRHPNYNGLSRSDAFAEYLAEWRTVPRRILVTAGTSTPEIVPEIVTVRNPRVFGFNSSVSQAAAPNGRRGRAVGYGWDAETRRFTKRWESSDLSGSALDIAIGDLSGDGRDDLVVLSGAGTNRTLDIFTLYDHRR